MDGRILGYPQPPQETTIITHDTPVSLDTLPDEVRIISAQGENLGVQPKHAAINLANSSGLDVVMLDAKSTPPVVMIADRGKIRYSLAKKQRDIRKHTPKTPKKEIVFRPNIDKHDYNTKMHSIREFLGHGSTVRIQMRFRGREITHIEVGQRVIDSIINDTRDITQPLQHNPVLEGKNLVFELLPKK